MRIRRDEEARVQAAAASALKGSGRVVLAVSGGLDSMVLLDAVSLSLSAPKSSVLVATFDHRTGPHALRAAKTVERKARQLGFRCVIGSAATVGKKESEWRDERWRFLRSVAHDFKAPVFTAHTIDDQIETVFMRILRDAGPRGLAGLYAESDIVRPFLELRRADLEAYAASRNIQYVEDPTNTSRAYLRNRVRHDLLPALTKVRPGFPASLLSIARLAATWREEMDDTLSQVDLTVETDGSLRVARGVLRGYDAESLKTLWPAIAAKAGVIMDRRGTHRLAEFTMKGQTGGSIQLSGGIEVRMFRDHLLLQKWDVSRVELIRNARLGLGGARSETRVQLS
jgi:tRNA(Ile)-lysidine synthase